MSESKRWQPDHPDYPELQRLIARIHYSYKDALATVNALREKGWLEDGSLLDAPLLNVDLHHANLHRASMIRVNLSNANLSDANLGGANLSHADLIGARLDNAQLTEAKLGHARLSGVNLNGANLSRAYLGDADLRGANLNNADLHETILKFADLRAADLRAANLNSARLFGANLDNATLSSTDLSGARLWGTKFINVDLSEVKGLDEVRHYGPCIVDLETLARSGGRVPDSFLRGIGASDECIEFANTLLAVPIQMKSVFIIYNVADKEFATHLHDRLQDIGMRCWLAKHDPEINAPILGGTYFGYFGTTILVCSKSSLTERWFDQQIFESLAGERRILKSFGKTVQNMIPVRLDDYVLDDDKYNTQEAKEVRERLAADFTNWKVHDAFEAAFEKLIKALKVHRSADPQPKLGRDDE